MPRVLNRAVRAARWRVAAGLVLPGLVLLAVPCPARGETPAAERARERARIAAELARLDGHRVAVAPDRLSYRILDIAGEGPPIVGVVERRGEALWLRSEDGAAVQLAGPLAVPRIAGPGYKVWVVGARAPGGALTARRIGVLSPPPR